MESSLALPSLVNAAGAFVFLLAGLAILAIVRRALDAVREKLGRSAADSLAFEKDISTSEGAA